MPKQRLHHTHVFNGSEQIFIFCIVLSFILYDPIVTNSEAKTPIRNDEAINISGKWDL